jgi:hypothetical protein
MKKICRDTTGFKTQELQNEITEKLKFGCPGCKTWSDSMRKEHRPGVFQNKMLRKNKFI